MTYETILYDVTDGVATISLNRPDKLNAFTKPMLRETSDAFKQVGRDPDVKCVIFTGKGRGFCAGQDLEESRNRPEGYAVGDGMAQTYHRLVKRIVNLEKPVIGALNGVVAGAGVGIALSTDLRIATEKCSFVLAFTKVGLIPDCGTNWLLPRIIGQARAYQLALTAEKLPAAKALDWGMINEIVPSDHLYLRANELATEFAQGAGLAFALTKRAMNRSWEMSLEEALEYEAHLQNTTGYSHDHQEGVQAFLEKRKPNFKGE